MVTDKQFKELIAKLNIKNKGVVTPEIIYREIMFKITAEERLKYFNHLIKYVLMYKNIKKVTFQKELDKKILKDLELEWSEPKNTMSFSDKKPHDNIIVPKNNILRQKIYLNHYVSVYNCKLEYKLIPCSKTAFLVNNHPCAHPYIHNISMSDYNIGSFILKDTSLLDFYVHYVKTNINEYKIGCLPKDIRKKINS